jgi:hypothetical protein
VEGYQQDPHAQTLLTQLVIQAIDTSSSYTLKDGLIRHEGRLWLAALYDSVVGGHSGVPVTYRRVKQLFAWKGMK